MCKRPITVQTERKKARGRDTETERPNEADLEERGTDPAERPLFGAIEGGGTKFVCIAATGKDAIIARARFQTLGSEETLDRVIDFFRHLERPVKAVGIGSFGPVDLDPESPSWGHITSTPKAGWQHVDLAGRVGNLLGVPVGFETDVNAAALGEHRWGAARGLPSCLYITVGTGIGGGAVIDGRPLHGLVHPEMGHIRVPRADGDKFAGTCPFHGDCLEGMASGPAIKARVGRSATELTDDDPTWQYVAHYLAHAVHNFTLTLSPHRVILGGGLMHRQHLFPMIRERLDLLLNGYVRTPLLTENLDAYVVPPGLGDDAGVLGALALALDASALERTTQGRIFED